MATLVLRPNADRTGANAWTKSSGTTGYTLLDDTVTDPTNARTGGDGGNVTSSTAAQAQGVEFPDVTTADIPSGSTLNSITLKVYASGGTKRQADLATSRGNQTAFIAAGAAAGWKTATFGLGAGFTLADINAFYATFTVASTGSGSATAVQIDAVYIVVDYTPPAVTYNATAALTGTGSLAGTAVRTRFATAALSGSGTLAATAVRTRFASAALTGVGTLAVAGTIRGQFVSVALSGSGTLAATAARTRFATAALSGSGTLAATATRQVYASAALVGSGALTATAGTSQTYAATAALSGSGTLAATATRQVYASAALSGSGTLAALAIVNDLATAHLTGVGTLTATATKTVYASAALSGSGTLAATSQKTAYASAELSGSGTLTASITSNTITTVKTGNGSFGSLGAPRRTIHDEEEAILAALLLG